MNTSTLNPTPARSWRDIPQPIKPRILGREGKKRLWLSVANVVGLVLLLGAAAWGIYEFTHMLQTDPVRITAPTKGVPLKDVVVRTDGVLDLGWVKKTLDLPKDISLMEINLVDAKLRLEASGQVSRAVIERRFPDKLIVTLQERTPLVRIMAQIANAEPVIFLVSRDGYVYSGFGYNEDVVQSLPYIDGVKLIRAGAGFERIDGMDAVADLLLTAQSSAPNLYNSFKVVSLVRFDLDRTLLVKTAEVDAVTFGTSRDSFFKQIARLDYILDETRRNSEAGQVKSINLAVGDKQVPVAFWSDKKAAPVDRSAASSARGATSTPEVGLFTFPSFNSSSLKRDF